MNTKLDNVLSKLENVQQHGDYYTACCPAHDDHRASLKVSVKRNGWIDPHCFAGCTENQVLAALNMENRDLAPDGQRNGAGPKPERRIVATYEYVDEQGALLFQAVRFDPKEFRQRRPDGRGGWIYDIKGVRRILYRLPELLTADPAFPVFLVEGEKDVDNLRAVGLVATCNPMGAGKWNNDYTKALSGRRVVLLPDNDEPGRKHRDLVAGKLAGIVYELKIVDLPNLPEHGDVSDWLAAGGTAEALLSIVDATEAHSGAVAVAEAPKEPQTDAERRAWAMLNYDATDNGNAEIVKLIHGADYLHVPSHGWLWWNGAFWTDELADPKIELTITDVLKERRKAAVDAERESIVKAALTNNSRIRAAKQRLTAHLAATIDTFDQDPDLLNCLNGVINLKTGRLTPHERQRFTHCVMTHYDPNATSQDWIAFLESVLPDPEVRDYLQLALGYTLTGHTKEECLFYLRGETRSGKSALAEVLVSLLGRPLATATEFSTFTAERSVDSQNFAIAPLKAARLVVASESGEGEYLNVGKVKQMTGGDFITAAHKHKDSFTFRPQWKIWLLSNYPPRGSVDDDALWVARLRVIEFPNSFLGHEDKDLKQRLRQPENQTGILAWLVEGARRWYAEGLKVPDSVTATTKRYRTELDWIAQWQEECCTQNAVWTANHVLYQSYENWCTDNGVKPKGARSWGKALSSKGFEVGVVKKVDGKTWRGVNGLSLVE